jgi:hypothetical protein
MKNFGGFDCTGWYLDFMDEMRGFGNQPSNAETLKEIKSRLNNAVMQVDELVRLQRLKENNQCSSWDGHSTIRHEGVHASFQPLKPKKYKKIKSKLKKAHLKAGRICSVDGQTEWAKQFSIDIKLGDQVVFSRGVPEVVSPYGLATLDVQTNLRVKEILQSALRCVNVSLGVDGYTFKY